MKTEKFHSKRPLQLLIEFDRFESALITMAQKRIKNQVGEKLNSAGTVKWIIRRYLMHEFKEEIEEYAKKIIEGPKKRG